MTPQALKPDDSWSRPLPARLPAPTYWPAATALGVTVALLGFVTQYAFLAAGLGLTAVSIAKWIGEMLRDSRG